MEEDGLADTPEYVTVGTVSRALGISRQWVRDLTTAGVLEAFRTPGGHRRYDLARTRAAWEQYRLDTVGPHVPPSVEQRASDRSDLASSKPAGEVVVETLEKLDGLHEDRVWRSLAPRLSLEEHRLAGEIAQYAFTEMLNNAIDHSGGDQALVRATRSDRWLRLEIADNGIGVFERLSEGKGLGDPRAAVAELTKGKQTTDPARHSGEGIFFTSKAVAVFSLAANGIIWIVDNPRGDWSLGASEVTSGTSVSLQVDLETDLVLGELFQQFTEDYEFKRTRPVVKLFELGVSFVSRSEAKRLLTGLGEFSAVELDFGGVVSVGQGFVDEMFRVWAGNHPDIALSPVNMNPAVQFMVDRARHSAKPS